MATFLDATLLGDFSIVFTFLLVWVIGFGALEVSSPFGKKTGLNAIAGLALAFLVVFTTPARVFIEFVVPWFAVMAVVFFFLYLAAMALGADTSFLKGEATGKIMSWSIAIGVIIALFGLGAAFNQPAQPVQQPQFQPNQPYQNPNGTVGALEGGNEVPPQQPVQQPVVQRSKFADKLIYTFTHPKMLGALFMLVFAALAIATLTAPVKLD